MFKDGILELYGPISDWDISAKSVSRDLRDAEGDILVLINSGGGVFFEGIAIYNVLRRYAQTKGRVSIEVIGLAASMASIIAMAGDDITLRSGAMMMVHDPWMLALGNAGDFEKTVDVLNLHADEMAAIYAKRTGLSETDIRAMMREETWMGAEEALEQGFATAMEEEAADEPSAFAYSLYANAPDHLAQFEITSGAWADASINQKGELIMPAESLKNKRPNAGPTPADPPAPPPLSKGSTDPNDAVEAERARASAITKAVAACGLEIAFAQELIDAGHSLEEAQAKIIDKVSEGIAAKDDDGPAAHRVNIDTDEREKFVEGAVAGQLHRFGVSGGERNEYSGMRLSDLARASLDLHGVKAPLDREKLVRTAFEQRLMASTSHTSGDFPLILENLATKATLATYNETPETWRDWCRVGTLPDFKQAARAGLDAFPNLSPVSEGGEISYGTIGERGEKIILASYGKIVGLTRQMIINDDLSEFMRILMSAGRTAARLEGDLAYGVLTANAALSDGKTLFHADHNNLASPAAAIGIASLKAAEGKIAEHTLGDASVTVTPKFMLVPPVLRADAAQLMASEHDPAKTSRAANPYRDYVQVIAERRLQADSQTAWYLAADPNMADTVEIAFLEGQQAPRIDTQEGWRVQGVEFKVEHDVGAAAMGYHGLFKNPGA